MEKGDECNKDHLATVEDSLKTREGNNRQWLVCGFNGFGQLKMGNKGKLQQFEEIQMPLTNENVEALLACSWNCLVVANGCSLHLQGFLSNCSKTVKSIQTEVPIKHLDICDKYCLVLTENGILYKLVPGAEDVLQEITFQTSLPPITPQKRDIFGGNKTSKSKLQIAHIACGNNITVAVSTMNVVFSGTTQIFQFPKHQRIRQLKCGFEHALLLTANGDLYSWGNGLRGQLGLEVLGVQETPTLIEALAGIKINYIAAGGWHSAAISAFGDLYTWGYNSNGQLGLRLYKTSPKTRCKEPSVYPLPQLIDLPTCQCCQNSNDEKDSCFPVKVVAGGRHTILQMNCGSIYASGWNKYGQLGLQPQQFCDNFKFVLKLEDENNFNNKQVICGSWCTIII